MFWIVGRDYIHNSLIVNTMSRSGKPSELTVGPVQYGLIMTLVTYFYWKRVCYLRDPHPLVRRRLFIPLWHHPEGESFSLVESVEDVVRSDCVRRVQFVGHHWVVRLLPDVRHLRVVSCREHLMRIRDADYVLHAIIVSVICGLTETLTIPNYDNITVSVVCVLLYDYIQKK